MLLIQQEDAHHPCTAKAVFIVPPTFPAQGKELQSISGGQLLYDLPRAGDASCSLIQVSSASGDLLLCHCLFVLTLRMKVTA